MKGKIHNVAKNASKSTGFCLALVGILSLSACSSMNQSVMMAANTPPPTHHAKSAWWTAAGISVAAAALCGPCALLVGGGSAAVAAAAQKRENGIDPVEDVIAMTNLSVPESLSDSIKIASSTSARTVGRLSADTASPDPSSPSEGPSE